MHPSGPARDALNTSPPLHHDGDQTRHRYRANPAIGYPDIAGKEEIDVRHAEKKLGMTPVESMSYRLMKLQTARVFMKKLGRYAHLFENAERILELGAGTCWASYLLKSFFPDKEIVATDLAPASVESNAMWLGFFDTRLDDTIACRSYDTPFDGASFDLIFCFEAAHHFGRHRRTLEEIRRLLAPDGRALYLHEPGCPRALYRAARWRALRKRTDVLEDVIVPRELVRISDELGLRATVDWDPIVLDRKPVETAYYTLLGRVPILQQVLPCTFNLVIERAGVSGRRRPRREH